MENKFENITDEELISEVKNRDLEDEIDLDYSKKMDELEIEIDEQYKRTHHVLPIDFDRFKLRDHLCNITRLGSYVSDEKLFNTLQDLLEYS